MPLPFLAAGIVGIAIKGGVAGIAGVSLAKKKKAKDTVRKAEYRNDENLDKLQKFKESANISVNSIIETEKKIVNSCERFDAVFEKIKNHSVFKELNVGEYALPEIDLVHIEKNETNLGISAVAIGAMLAGGGLLFLPVVFMFGAGKAQQKAEEAWDKMSENEKKINSICAFLDELTTTADKYNESMNSIYDVYDQHLSRIEQIVNNECRCDYRRYSDDEKLAVKNTSLLLQLLRNMCRIKLTTESKKEGEMNKVNTENANKQIVETQRALNSKNISYSSNLYNVFIMQKPNTYYVSLTHLSEILPINIDQANELDQKLEKYQGIAIAGSIPHQRATELIREVEEKCYNIKGFMSKETNNYPSYKILVTKED